MKWLIYLALIGVIEVSVIGKLHGILGFYKLIGVYITTTLIGAIFLVLQLQEFRKSWKYMKKLEKKSLKKFKDKNYKLTVEELEKAQPMLFFMIYSYAVVLIAIPGIVSDIIGIIIVIPFISNYYLEFKMNKAKQKLNAEKP